MQRNAWYWIRWILALPLSILLALFIGNLTGYFWTVALPVSFEAIISNWFFNAFRSLFQSFWFVLLVGIIVPEHKKTASTIAFGILLILMTFSAGTMFGLNISQDYAITSNEYWVSLVASFIGGGIGLIISLQMKKTDEDLDDDENEDEDEDEDLDEDEDEDLEYPVHM